MEQKLTAMAELIQDLQIQSDIAEASRQECISKNKPLEAEQHIIQRESFLHCITIAQSLLPGEREQMEDMWNEGGHYGYTGNPGTAQSIFDKHYTQNNKDK